MARPLRNDDMTGWFHVNNRGARKYDTFIDDDDRQTFVDTLGANCPEFGIEVAAICLMANHYHLIVNCPAGGISSLLQRVGSTYTKRFNRAHGFDGPLNSHRFDARPILTDDYLVTATRYVHRNPLEVGIDITTYPWSSYRGLLVNRPHSMRGLPIFADVPLQLAGGQQSYINFVKQDLPTDKASYSNGSRHYADVRRSRVASLDVIDQTVSEELGRLTNLSGSPHEQSKLRQLGALLASDKGAHSIDEIAAHYSFTSNSSVYSAIRRARRRVEESGTDAATLQRSLLRLKSE